MKSFRFFPYDTARHRVVRRVDATTACGRPAGEVRVAETDDVVNCLSCLDVLALRHAGLAKAHQADADHYTELRRREIARRGGT